MIAFRGIGADHSIHIVTENGERGSSFDNISCCIINHLANYTELKHLTRKVDFLRFFLLSHLLSFLPLSCLPRPAFNEAMPSAKVLQLPNS